jgi:hypothetical protein
MDLNFYKDKKSSFQCDIEVEGSSENNTEARIILEIDNKNYLFYGTVKNSLVEIDIPALNFTEEESGNAVLEIIAENTMFKPFSSKFNIKRQKNVKLNEGMVKVVVKDEKKVKAIVKEVKEVIQKTEINENNKKDILTFKKSCSREDKKEVTLILKEFNKLNKLKKTIITNLIKKHNPALKTRKKINRIFEGNSFGTKIAAYYIEANNETL